MNVSEEGCVASPPSERSLLGSRVIIPYIAAEIIIAILSTTGNFLVCLAVIRNRKLRTVTNYFLVSLAVADLFVGLLAIPCAILTGLGHPHYNLPLCLLLLSTLIVLTQSSVLSLLAVAAERYVAILLPLQYQHIMSPRNARLLLVLTWTLAFLSGAVPLMGWHGSPPPSGFCVFTYVVNMSYMVYFNFFGCMLVPLVVMFIIYARIFITVRQHLRRIADLRGIQGAGAGARAGAEAGTNDGALGAKARASDSEPETEVRVGCVHQAGSGTQGGPGGGGLGPGAELSLEGESTNVTQVYNEGGGVVGEKEMTHYRPSEGVTEAWSSHTRSGSGTNSGSKSGSGGVVQLGAAREVKRAACMRSEMSKATSLFLILFLFMLCWLPLHCINCVLLLCPDCHVPLPVSLAAILLSHANSALNPLLYAYRMKSFRHTLKMMCLCQWHHGNREGEGTVRETVTL